MYSSFPPSTTFTQQKQCKPFCCVETAHFPTASNKMHVLSSLSSSVALFIWPLNHSAQKWIKFLCLSSELSHCYFSLLSSTLDLINWFCFSWTLNLWWPGVIPLDSHSYYIIFLNLIACFPYHYLKDLFFPHSLALASAYFLIERMLNPSNLIPVTSVPIQMLLPVLGLPFSMTLHVTASLCAFSHCRLRAFAEGSSLYIHLSIMFCYNMLALSLHFLCWSYYDTVSMQSLSSSLVRTPVRSLPSSHTLLSNYL